MDLEARSLDALDWGAVLERLTHHARTMRGAAAAALPDFADDREAALHRYGEVAEVQGIEASGDLRIPIGGVGDVAEPVTRAGRGIQLDMVDLRDIGATVSAFDRLRRFLGERDEDAPILWETVSPHELEGELLWRLTKSFDQDGQLSGELYPELAELRNLIAATKKRIRSTLDELVRSEGLGDALQDRFITERGGRFVLPVKSSRRAGIGIVHDTSQSGETVFIEPAAVVEQHNHLKEVEAQLIREERRILIALSALVGTNAEPILAALDAAMVVDLACARTDLGWELEGVLPDVGKKGVIDLKDGRHAVLQIRGIDVVANDLHLDHDNPALVLTGPNTGGKTIAMKTLGLSALFVRAGIPIPAAEGSRVDFFNPVLASVGDLQSVEGDLSTFSGQVVVIKAVLERAAPGSLVLLDEIAVGTDPAQGAALARAVLEAVVDTGARLSITTHYTELKALAKVDSRFSVAAMEYVDGRPTYKLAIGMVGQSHALSTAKRLGLSESVLRRAQELLGTGQRELGELLDRLEAERINVSRREAQAKSETARLRQRDQKLERELARLRERSDNLRREVAGNWAERIKAREQEIVELIAALQANPNLRTAGKTLEQIRAIRDRAEADVSEPERAPGPPPKDLSVGDRVRVRSLNKMGEVLSISGSRVEVQVGRMQTRVKLLDLESVAGRRFEKPESKPVVLFSEPTPVVSGGTSVRTGSNSCDLRGMRVDAALERVEKFLDDVTLQGAPTGHILHGHGTGALKQALRQYLPTCGYAKSWRPGDESEGGDAWTVVEIR